MLAIHWAAAGADDGFVPSIPPDSIPVGPAPADARVAAATRAGADDPRRVATDLNRPLADPADERDGTAVRVESGAPVDSAVIIGGPPAERTRATVGPNDFIHGARDVHRDTHVGHPAEVTNGGPPAGARVPHRPSVEDALAAPDAPLDTRTAAADRGIDSTPARTARDRLPIRRRRRRRHGRGIRLGRTAAERRVEATTYPVARRSRRHTTITSGDPGRRRESPTGTVDQVVNQRWINTALRISKGQSHIVSARDETGGKQECRGGPDSSHPIERTRANEAAGTDPWNEPCHRKPEPTDR